jgi:xanthine dehydrogenase accessory factor
MTDPNCGVAHGAAAEGPGDRVLVAVFASPVASFLLRYAADCGFTPVLVEPDGARVAAAEVLGGTTVTGFAELDALLAAGTADVVVTDHHRDELGAVLRDAVAALAALGVPPEQVARVHRPIGLDIGSRTPAEIAVSTVAGLLADRTGRSGGFAHGR